jgi:hypothetical protein
MRSISNYGPDCHALSLSVNGAQSRSYQKRFHSIYSYSFCRLREESIL